MRILYIHQFFTTPKGAGGTRSYELARRMVDAGDDVTVICGSLLGGNTGLDQPFSKGRREGFVDGIRVVEFELPYHNEHSFFRRAISFMRFSARVSHSAITRPADLIFATSPPITVALPTVLVRLLTRRTIVAEIRDPWPESPQAMGVVTNPVLVHAISLLQRAFYKSAHHAIALSPGIANLIAAGGVPRQRISTVPNGSDIALFSGIIAPRVSDIPADCLIALYAGTHGIANNLDAVLDAAAELVRRGEKKVRIVLCGAGQLKQKLQARVQQECLVNVTFMAPVPKDKIGEIMAGADIGLQVLMNIPVFYECTSPNKFFDYIAAGLPVLINYPGWVANMIEENKCGYVVPPQDAHAFADALQDALKDKQSLKQMGLNANNLARREFDRDTLANTLLESLKLAFENNNPKG